VEPLYRGAWWDNDALDDTVFALVADWARSCRLEADWLIHRVNDAVTLLHTLRDNPNEPDPPNQYDPEMWGGVAQYDPELISHESLRATPPYSKTSLWDKTRPPERRLGPRPQFPRARTAASFGQALDWLKSVGPIAAWPDMESRAEFQARAIRHFKARAALAESMGLALYRKSPALERHAVWLLQQRVLRMRLEDIANFAQQERETRQGGGSSVIDPRSVSREIKDLETLLPL